jgi:hypothetical protein
VEELTSTPFPSASSGFVNRRTVSDTPAVDMSSALARKYSPCRSIHGPKTDAPPRSATASNRIAAMSHVQQHRFMGRLPHYLTASNHAGGSILNTTHSALVVPGSNLKRTRSRSPAAAELPPNSTVLLRPGCLSDRSSDCDSVTIVITLFREHGDRDSCGSVLRHDFDRGSKVVSAPRKPRAIHS